MISPSLIRNIAIVAHIDHGKTTLLDSLLKQSQLFRKNEQLSERMMDSYDQEKERGITIFAKHTSLPFKDYRINVIDTPGHADFSAEVERVLGMVNSVLLLVDAKEGPMPQTRFVLSKALKMGLKPIVVVNKIDKPHADPMRVLDETFDLFVELGATDAQLDFSFCFASGLGGFASDTPEGVSTDMTPLFELIVRAVPPPEGDLEKPFLMQVSSLFYDDYLGRQACGRILDGTVKKNATLFHAGIQGVPSRFQVSKIEGFLGLKKIDLEEASAGDIVIISGVQDILIGDTLSQTGEILPRISLEEPTVAVTVTPNPSPLASKESKHVTVNKLRERFEKEARANISFTITVHEQDDKITVKGRGELHLAVLFEAMRREGYAFSVSKPEVITKEDGNTTLEPYERVFIELPEEYSGKVIEAISKRKGEMQSLSTNDEGLTDIEFLIPTRGIMGYRNEFLTSTRGLGILTKTFEGFFPWKGEISGREKGVLVSMSAGKATAYACFSLQDRGTLFVTHGDEVYENMIVGEHTRSNDLVVNVTKQKQLTNVRASGTDENLILSPPREFNLEQAIDYIEKGEQVDITPLSLRLRKANT